MLTGDSSIADIVFQLDWQSAAAVHTEIRFARNVNFWRDSFPAELYDDLLNRAVGAEINRTFPAGTFLPPPDSRKIFDIASSQFRRNSENLIVSPCRGRFYPKGVLSGIAGVFSENSEPFRVVAVHDSKIRVDFNHPLAGKSIIVTAKIDRISRKRSERGGSYTDWMETLTRGPGMQARWGTDATDFFSGHPFCRQDEKKDEMFYLSPRLVSHIDDYAKKSVGAFYRRYLGEGMRILDLMSSWESHLPAGISFAGVTALGLNSVELARNMMADDYIVHDLNEDPLLPFAAELYDAVVCTASIEYLTRPFEVFREVCRVLKPGGTFAVTFSNRWFPPKAVAIWTEIHDFERIGLVTEYFLESGGFTDIETFSSSGFPRPETDKYYGQYLSSDPVYGVAGRKR